MNKSGFQSIRRVVDQRDGDQSVRELMNISNGVYLSVNRRIDVLHQPVGMVVLQPPLDHGVVNRTK